MSDPVIGAILGELFAIMHKQIEEELRLVVGVDKDIQNLQITLESIQAVILDAEKKQVKEANVRLWLQRLRDALYDMDDVLAEWRAALLKAQWERLENTSPKEKVFSFLTFPCFCFGIVLQRHDIVIKVKELNERLDQIATEKQKYSLNSNSSSSEGTDRFRTTSYVEASKVRGRDEDKTNLIKKLLKESSQSERNMGLNLISVVGMGGIGKTTLARLAYNSAEVTAHFEMTMWVVVSEPFDVVRIAKAVVEDVENKSPDVFELETLLRRLRNSINKKKYLLVLDDVWTEESGSWEPLISSLEVGAPGSTILVTTRNIRVARILGCNDLLNLGVLSDQDCWELFSQHAFSGRSKEDLKHLEAIGRKIANKCKGLPLAAKTVGSLMCFKNTVQEWQIVLESDMWELEEAEKGRLFPPLLLSYYELPPALRRCFSYCAIFPKDSEIEADNLIKLWMAQGYLSLKKETNMEVIGREYLECLASRCLFQELKRDKGTDKIMHFKMHDMVHDLALYLMHNECSMMEVGCELELKINSALAAIRHLTLVRSQDISFPSSIGNTTKLHTFWVQSFYDCPQLVAEVDKFSDDFFEHLLPIKALDISRNRFQQLPKEVGMLFNLRYLNLSHNPLVELPDTICELYNLQTLKLIACKHLERLPSRIGKVMNLRHLEIDRTDHLRKLPKEIGKLRCLQTLSKFILSSSNDDDGFTCNLGDLKYLNQLQGCLKLEGLGHATSVEDARKAELNKKQVTEVHMDFQPLLPTSNPTAELIEALQLHQGVQFLTMTSYAGVQFPSWIVSLSNLRKLQLQDCQNCIFLPPLGKLQSLETLYIENMHGLKRIGEEFLGVKTNINGAKQANVAVAGVLFPKLKKLKVEGMSSWEEWSVTNVEREVKDGNLKIMPCLTYLKISGCSKLEELPEILLRRTPIRKLRIQNCPRLHRKYGYRTGEQWPKSHVPKVRIV